MDSSNFPRYLRIFTLIACLSSVSGGMSFAQGTLAVDAKLLAEARIAWAEYEKVARVRSWKISVEAERVQPGKPPFSYRDVTIVKSNGPCVSIEEDDFKDAGLQAEARGRTVKVVGRDYQFEAKRPAGTKDWELDGQIVRHADLRAAIARKQMTPPIRTTRDEIDSEFLLSEISVDFLLARRMIDLECCRTERFAPVDAKPGSLIEWRFTTDAEKRPPNMRKVEKGRVLFDPTNKWIIKEYSTDNRNGVGGISKITYSSTYRKGRDGNPVLDEIKTTLSTEDGLYRNKGIKRFELIPQKEELPDSGFELKAYGLS